MNIYLAKNAPFNGYDNMQPLYELINGKLVEKDFSEEFPFVGKLTLYQNVHDANARFPIPDVFICKVDFNQIVEVNPPVTDERRNKLQVFANRLKYENIDSYSIHQVLEMPAYTNIEKLQKSGILYTNSQLSKPLSNYIYIKDTINVYGPFSWEFNDNESLVVNIKADQSDNMINEFRIDDIKNSLYALDISDRDGSDIREIILTENILANAKQIEFITDKDLHRKFVKDIKKIATLDVKINRRDMQEIIDAIPKLEISETRKRRLISDFKDYNALQEVLEDLAKTVMSNPETKELVYTELLNNPHTREQVVEDLKDREDFSEDLQAVQNEIELKILEKDLLLDEVEKIQKQIEDLSQEKLIESENEELNELKGKRIKLTNDIQELQKKYDLSTEIGDWEEKIERQKIEHDSFTGVNASLKDALAEKVKNAYMDVAFNGQIANEVLKAAAGYAKTEDHQRYALMMARQDKVPNVQEIMEPSEFIDMVQTTLNRDCHRMMSRNDVINVMLCLTQGFLTVFAGEPGSGKTSLCNYLSKILGLSRKDDYSRYIEVSVEKGWTSKRDFIGYYNPLTKQFDQANRKVFEAFNILNHEVSNGINDYPFVVMLDEANLSPMEHYWADFMNTADMNKDKREINLNEQYELKIPQTLRFLATINYDHTTEILSPRLIDRAWIILLESGNLNINDAIVDKEIEPLPLISYQQLTSVFGVQPTRSLDENTVEKFNEINNTLRANGLFISPRVMSMIKNYCVAGSMLFDKKMNRFPALDYAVAQKILPMINGYGETYKMFLNNLLKNCDKNNMPVCNRIIQDIIKKGDLNMQYYQFFAK